MPYLIAAIVALILLIILWYDPFKLFGPKEWQSTGYTQEAKLMWSTVPVICFILFWVFYPLISYKPPAEPLEDPHSTKLLDEKDGVKFYRVWDQMGRYHVVAVKGN